MCDEITTANGTVIVHSGSYTMDDYVEDYGDQYIGPTYFEPEDDYEFGPWDGYGDGE